MRNLPIAFLSALSLVGCSTIGRLQSDDPVRTFRRNVSQVLSDSLFIPSNVSLVVVSLESGEVLFSRNSKLLMRPASNTKLLTSAAALHVLGTSYQFRTVALCDSLDEATGTCYNLYLKGYGNPDLTANDLDSISSLLWNGGVRRIDGDIVADGTFFDNEYWAMGWMWDDEPDPDGMPVSALSVNKNCVRVNAWPDSLTGTSIEVSLEPPTSYVHLVNCAIVSSDTMLPRLRIQRLFRERSNTIVVEGALRPGARMRSERITVWQPELYAGTLLREACERRGITVSGVVRFGKAAESAREMVRHTQPIDSMITNLNKISDNLSAENTLKTLSAATYGSPGTTRGGLYVVNSVLAGLGIDTTLYRFVDGSGLSHYNLVSAETLIRLLASMYRSTPLFPLFYSSLPVAGVDGTLARRMRGTPAEGNLHAKTGTISGVSSLSGYVTTQDGELLAFSMSMQNFIAPSDRYRDIQDRIGALMASFSRKRVIAASQSPIR